MSHVLCTERQLMGSQLVNSIVYTQPCLQRTHYTAGGQEVRRGGGLRVASFTEPLISFIIVYKRMIKR